MTKTIADIRKEFLGYFEDKGHTPVRSSPLVPQNDPTLMFVNSGMVQFKDVFTGKEKRDYTRATSSQKCVRAGGKHNDLENVGYTARHHTFFEMLGNFSFGDYFKEDAIAFAWELITKNFGLPPEKLLATVHTSDEEAADIWKKVAGFSDDKIIRIPTDDNFWRMGDTGPCGPCTEIFYDHGEDIWGGPPGSPEEDGDRFIEIWNIVFMQYEQVNAETRIDLPKQSVDTGMGLERIAAVLQGVHNNYDTDLFTDIIQHSAELTKSDAGLASHKVIADHLRSSSFLIADGVLPSKDGRGYVLRRIMRRAMRHAHQLGQKTGMNEPLMHQLFPTLQSKMAEAFPELNKHAALITETLRQEEERFKATLTRGLQILEEEADRLSEGSTFPGDVAFKLYDTYGFPLDLTQDALRPKNIGVDTDAFDAAMAKQKEEARKSWKGSGDAATDELWFELADELPATEFLGYSSEAAEGEVLCLLKDGKRVKTLKKGESGIAILNQTPFYAEAGGQVGDTGMLTNLNNEGFIKVNDTQKKLGKLWAHHIEVEKGSLAVGDGVRAAIDVARRNDIRANHSATHLLNSALILHLGAHVTQKGSLVDEKRLRFDISHPKPLTEEEIRNIEATVNEEIRANTEAVTRLLPLQDAIDAGAIAMAGEAYDEEVRVLSMGRGEEGQRPYSVELCGGTHVRRTGDIGLFKIVAQSAVSAGVRRIEAMTGRGALAYLSKQDDTVKTIAANLKVSAEDVAARIETLAADRKKLEQEVADLRRKVAAGGGANDSGPEIKKINDIVFIGKVLDGIPAKDLKPMADTFKGQIGSGVVVLASSDEGKASLVVAVTDDLTSKINAVDLVKIGAEALGGKGGGGRPDMAQAGGPNENAKGEAIEAIQASLSL